MRNRRIGVRLFLDLVIAGAIISACAIGAASGSEVVNLVKETGLENSTEIEVLEFVNGDFVSVNKISDPGEIGMILKMLDIEIPLTARNKCMANYKLLFSREDGSHQEFEYQCGESELRMIRGSQIFWKDSDGILPENVNQALMEALRLR